MRQLIKKFEFKRYYGNLFYDYNPIDLYSDTIEDYHVPSSRPLFRIKETNLSGEFFEENLKNKLASVYRSILLIVIEKYDNKLSLKFFENYLEKPVGGLWYKRNKHVRYITFDLNKGFVYSGLIWNYHKKKNSRKEVRKNSFVSNPLNSVLSIISGTLNSVKYDNCNVNELIIEIKNSLQQELFQSNAIKNSNHNNLEDSIFFNYLDKRGIKYPDNMGVYRSIFHGPTLRKLIAKSDNNFIEALMKLHKWNGKKLKKILHEIEEFNVDCYWFAKELFPSDWLNQDEKLLKKIFTNKYCFGLPIEQFKELLTKEELKRVFETFKLVIDTSINSHTFQDHMNYYLRLKKNYEPDLKWNSGSNKPNSIRFREEHLDWSDKIEFYTKSKVFRLYKDEIYELLSEPYQDFYFVLLDNYKNYNEESFIQSNCVKNYIKSANSFIVSVREGSKESEERATIEYHLSNKDSIKRIQSLGKYNSNLTEKWNLPLSYLDSLSSEFLDKKIYDYGIKEELLNGQKILLHSSLNEDGIISWELKPNL